jgi:hypothetical protein
MKIRKNVPWDLLLSVIAFIGIYLSLPYHIPATVLKEIYFTGMVALSILFAALIATISLIAGKARDENAGISLKRWRFTLKIAFSSLVYFAVFYFYTAYSSLTSESVQNKTWISIGSFLFLYSLWASFRTVLSVLQRFETQSDL